MFKIAIDGPSGAGKSTLAKRLSKRLGFVYVDTGALYRSIGLYIYENSVSPDDSEAVVSRLPEITLELKYNEGSQEVWLNGRCVNGKIREPHISMYASKVSAIPRVREFLLETQRSIARANNVIMDGRDIGTVIMPDADVKLFLVSSFETRAERRVKELAEKGITVTYEEVLSDMIERDKNDSTRKTAPLTAADDAVMLDNSKFTLEETLEAALAIILPRLEAKT